MKPDQQDPFIVRASNLIIDLYYRLTVATVARNIGFNSGEISGVSGQADDDDEESEPGPVGLSSHLCGRGTQGVRIPARSVAYDWNLVLDACYGGAGALRAWLHEYDPDEPGEELLLDSARQTVSVATPTPTPTPVHTPTPTPTYTPTPTPTPTSSPTPTPTPSPTPTPTPTPTPSPTPTPTPIGSIRSITLSADTTTPAVNSGVVITPSVSTSPPGRVPIAYRWQLKRARTWTDLNYSRERLRITMGQRITVSFRVVVQLGAGVSAASQEIQIEWGASPTATPTPTATPAPYIAAARNIRISDAGLITWDASSRAAGGYRVRHKLWTGAWSAANVAARFTSYQIPNFSKSFAYQATVAFLDANGRVIRRTLGNARRPATPGGVTAAAVDAANINLSWNSSTGSNRYRVETSPAGKNEWASLPVTRTTSYAMGNLDCDTAYDFRIRGAYLTSSSVAWSAPSAPVSARTAACPTYYPNRGSFSYDGNLGASAWMTWDNPAWSSGSDCNILWPYDCATYEHDFAIKPGFFSGRAFDWCTSMSNLPGDYDDCVTAGIFEPGDYISFSFGSARAHDIVAGQEYEGMWTFKGHGDAMSTTVKLIGQEGHFVNSVSELIPGVDILNREILLQNLLGPQINALLDSIVCTTVKPPIVPDPRPWCIKANRSTTLDSIPLTRGVTVLRVHKIYPSSAQ